MFVTSNHRTCSNSWRTKKRFKLYKFDCLYDKACNVKSIENIPLISLKEVIDLAKNIKMFKSSGMDNISSRLIKDTILAIPEQITYLFNASIKTGMFPDSWKMGRVTPIPKNGDVTNLNNIRPITLTPIIGQLMEKYINDKVVEFLETNE